MNTTEAKAQIKKGLVMLRAFEHAEDLVTLLDTAEAKADATNKSLKKLEKSVADLKLQEDNLLNSIFLINTESNKIVESANAAALKIIDDANKAAGEIIAEATEKLSIAKSDVQNENTKLVSIQSETLAAAGELDQIKKALEAAKAKLKGFIA